MAPDNADAREDNGQKNIAVKLHGGDIICGKIQILNSQSPRARRLIDARTHDIQRLVKQQFPIFKYGA